MSLTDKLAAVKKASSSIAQTSSGTKNRILDTIVVLIREKESEILEANAVDVEKARGTIPPVMLDRLTLNHERLEGIIDSIAGIKACADPTGEVVDGNTRPNGLFILKKRVPIGVIAVIYESRPNVTVDAAALCIKSGNAVILRGGKEAYGSNLVLCSVIREALARCSVDSDAVYFVSDTSHDGAQELMNAVGYVDLLIPRGGKQLIQTAVRESRVPILETGAGVCAVYVDSDADLEKALDIVENAKMSRPSVCNSEETLLVHSDIASVFLPILEERIGAKCELRCDERASKFIKNPTCAGENDWTTEYNDYILAVGIVDSADEAIEHINRCGTHHSDAIITESVVTAQRFLSLVDSAAVYLNASTRFTDGGEFGLSAEIGISTQKLHARGPVGLRELTTTKYIILGNGQVR